jgi:hypothetical protein
MRREGLQARGIYKEVPRPSRGLALAAAKRSLTVLSQLIIKGLFRCNIITLNSLLIKIASFTIYNRANNLASMLNVVTISYLFAL